MATVSKSGSQSNAVPSSPAPPSGGGDSSSSQSSSVAAGIGGGIAAAAVLLVVVLVVAVVVVSVCLRKRKNKHVNTTDNVAYHCSNSSGQETMKPMLTSVVLASLPLMMHMASLAEQVM